MKGKGKIGERDKEKWEGGEGNKVSCKFIQYSPHQNSKKYDYFAYLFNRFASLSKNHY